MKISFLRLLSCLLWGFSFCFSTFAQQTTNQNQTIQNNLVTTNDSLLTQTVHHFPPPFDDVSFPFVTVEINSSTPNWAKLLYEVNPNIIEIMDLHQAWRNNNPTIKNGHTRNYKKLIGYLMENNYVNEEGFIEIPTSQENKAKQKKILKDRKKFSNNNGAALRTSTNNTDWENLGPYHMKETNGNLVNRHINVYSITQSLSNPDILYCGTEAGGTIFKSIDHGDNWFSVSDSLLASMGSRELEVAPTDPDIVYLGTKHDIYKTTTGGNNWVSVYNTNNLQTKTILVHPTNANIVLAGGDTGILKTTDGGQNWMTVFPNEIIYDLQYKTNNPQTVFALINNPTTKQTDFYKSTDGGDTWTLKTNGWPSATSTSNIGGRMTVSTGHPNIIYAFIGASWTGTSGKDQTKVMKSSNAGETWTTVVDYNNSLGINSGQKYYDWDIEMSDVDSNVVFLGTQNRWVTKDGFATVNQNVGNLGHADLQEALFNGNDLWVVNDGGVILFDDETFQNYSVISTGINAVSYWSFDQGWNRDAQIGTHYHNGTSARTDTYEAGITINFGGAEPSFSLVAQPNAEKVVSKGYGSVNGKTMPDDQNGSYSSFNYNIEPNQDWYDGTNIAVDLLQHNTHYAALENAIMKSTDFGVTWETLFSFLHTNEYVEVIELTRANTNVIYVGTTHSSGSSIYRSADGGVSFVEMTSPFATNNFHISVSNENANLLFAGGDRKYSSGGEYVKIAKSIDGGVTWIDLWSPILDGYDFRKVMQVDGTDGGLYLLTTKAVFYRNNTMQDWEALVNGIPPNASLDYIKPFYKENKLRIATSRGIFGADLYETPQLANVLLQPTVDRRNIFCGRDTLYFDDYSVVEHDGATWSWSFPGATFISNTNVRNPKVIYAQSGKYNVTMSITKGGQTYTKTIEEMIEVEDLCGTVDDFAGQALSLSGETDVYVATTPINLTTTTLSISAWVKRTSDDVYYNGIVSCQTSAGTVGLNLSSNPILKYHYPGTSEWQWNSGHTLPLDEWAHVALVITPTETRIYMNGVPAIRDKSSNPLSVLNLDNHFQIGAHNGFREFEGNIDEVAIWKKALTETEVKEQMHLTKNPAIDTDLLAYYQFNENTNDAYDKAGTLHGKLLNGATRVTSSAPVGSGFSDTQTEINGIVNFSNTNFTSNFATQSGAEVVVSKINTSPYNHNGLLENDVPFDDQYWAVHRFGSGDFLTDLTLKVSEDITTTDEGAACRLALYGRKNTSDEDWIFVTSASTANATTDEVNFENVEKFEQYLVAHSDQPIMRTVDFISLKNTLVGNSSQEVSYEFSAANLVNNGLVTAPVGFEISLTSGTGFTNSLTLVPVNGKIQETIFVRFTPMNTSLHLGDIVHSSIGANNLIVKAEGLGFELDKVPGMALDLDGSSDYVNLGNPSELQITGDLTIQMWVKPANFSARRNPIGKAYGGEYTITQETDGTLTFYNGQSGSNSGSYQQISSNTSLNLNEWNHITLVRDITNTQSSWYINGTLTNQEAITNTSITAGNNSVYIGEGYVSGYAGLIDEVRIWNTALTQQQIREQMHLTLNGNDSGLVAYFQFNETSGNAKDLITGIDGLFVNQATRTTATEPVGVGFSHTQTEANGIINFPNTNFTSDFISQNGASIVASKIELSPNDTNGIGTNETPADEQYWVVNRFGTGTFDANLTFTLSEDLTIAEAAAPNTLKLYGRQNTSDGNWIFISNATTVNAATDEVTYNNVTTFEQYLITRNPFPKVIIQNISLNFGNVDKDVTSPELSYTVSASDLTTNLLITAPSGFEISQTSGSGFSNNLNLSPTSGTITSTTIYVRFTPNANMYFSGEITHTSTGASTRNIVINGTGVVPEIEIRQDATVLSNNDNVDFGNKVIGESNTLIFSIKNKDLGSLNLSGTPIISIGGTNASDFIIDETSTTTPLLTDASTTFKITFIPSGNGTRNANISIANNDSDESPFVLNLTGHGDTAPNLLVTSNLTPFGLSLIGSTSTTQSYTISGTALLEDVVISATPGFEISLNSGSGFSSSINLSPSNGTLATTTIYVRFAPTSVTDYSGSILHTSSSATTQVINVSGESYQLAETTPTNSVYFNGLDQVVAIPNSSVFQFGTVTDFTVALWIKTDNWQNDASIASNKDWDSGSKVGWNLALGTDGQGIDVNIGDGSNRADLEAGNLNDGHWHHIAATFDRDGDISLYVDGVLEQSTSMANVGNITNSHEITFGADIEYDYEYIGKIDEAKIWNTALTAQQVREAMHITSEWNTPNLIGYYQFNESNYNLVEGLKTNTHGTMKNGVTRMISTAPIGGGMVNTQTEANGMVIFPTTNFETDFSTQNAAEVVVSRINLPPNIAPANLERIFDAQYWAVHRYGTGTFIGDITFTVSEDLTMLDEATPSDIQLYGRGANTDDIWTLIGTAAMVDADLNQATFTNISSFKQFFLASTTDGGDLNCQVDVYFENTIALPDTTKSATFIEAGNLTGVGDVIISNSQTKRFEANDIILKPGFHAKAGSDFTATIDGCTMPTALTAESSDDLFLLKEKEIQDGQIDLHIYPNPSSTEFTATFLLEEDSKISLELFDILGQRVSTILPSQTSSSGAYQVYHNHNNLRKGTYVLLLIVNDEKVYQKVIIH